MIKRIFDFLLAVFGLVVASPILVLISIAVLILDGRPVFFVQQRVGRNGSLFNMYKFRTMKVKQAVDAALITVAGDSRITTVGKILRATKLDELPQLFNVLKGEMSFVGPRPEVTKYVDLYSSDQRAVLNLVPGITDPASLTYFNESEILEKQSDPNQYYIEYIMPHKIEINLRYAQSANIFTDLKMILMTVARAAGFKTSQKI